MWNGFSILYFPNSAKHQFGLAGVIEPLAKKLKVSGFHVFGHAFGAEVAQEYAKSAPAGMVASLLLAAPPKSMAVDKGAAKVGIWFLQGGCVPA